MDEIVWVLIGVLGVIIAIGAVAGAYQQYAENEREQAAQQSIGLISGLCDQVCTLPNGTYLSVAAQLPSGGVLFTRNDTLCMRYDQLYCKRCGCGVEDYTLDLNTSEARKAFRTHEYKCFFRNQGLNLSMNCVG